MEVVNFDFLLNMLYFSPEFLTYGNMRTRKIKQISIIAAMNSNGNIFIVTNIEIGILIK